MPIFNQTPEEEDSPILSRRPPLPPSERGEKISMDQDQYAQQVEDLVERPLTFSQSFKEARSSGKTKFTHDGKRFNTMKRGESDTKWERSLKSNKRPVLTGLVPGLTREQPVEDTLFKLANGAQVTQKMMDVTDEFNQARAGENLPALRMTSGYRTAKKNVKTMINAIVKSPSLGAALNAYTRDIYQQPIRDYFANKTEANLEKIREARRGREKVISTGHAHYGAMDYSVSDLSSEAEALERVAWLQKQGYTAKLEYWGGSNAHIHVEGVAH